MQHFAQKKSHNRQNCGIFNEMSPNSILRRNDFATYRVSTPVMVYVRLLRVMSSCPLRMNLSQAFAGWLLTVSTASSISSPSAGAALGLNSCNVVRTITNRSEFYQRGYTSVMIQTRTTETYDANEKLLDKAAKFL